MFCDCHSHLDAYEPQKLEEVIKRARDSGIESIVAVGKTVESSEKTVAISEQHDILLPAVGIHPWDATTFNPEQYQRLLKLTAAKKVVAIGEIGLDYARYPETAVLQRQSFEAQLELAKESGLPVIVHCRQAHKETVALAAKAGGVRGIAHGFNGDEAMLRDWLDLGFYISLGMAVTDSKETALHKLLRKIPIDRLLIETDSTPTRFVTEGLEPASVRLVAQRISELRRLPIEEVAAATTANLKRLLELGTERHRASQKRTSDGRNNTESARRRV